MPLDEYLTRQGKSIQGFAKEVGVSRQSLHNYLNGRTVPTGKVARMIVRASDYQITLEDLWHHIDYKEEVDDVL